MGDSSRHTANHLWLSACIELIRFDLEIALDDLVGPEIANQRRTRSDAIVVVRETLPEPPPLEVVAQMFGLSPFEQQLLLLCAGIELDGRFAELVAAMQGSEEHYNATFSLALANLSGPHWDAIAPTGPLRHWLMIDVRESLSLSLAPLRIDERVLHYLVGEEFLDPRLGAKVVPINQEDVTPSIAAVSASIAEVWGCADMTSSRLVFLSGSAEERAMCAASATSRLRKRLALVRPSSLPNDRAALNRLARLWEREFLLSDTVLMIDDESLPSTEGELGDTVARFCDEITAPLIVGTRDRPSISLRRSHSTFDVPSPTRREQRVFWRSALSDFLPPPPRRPRKRGSGDQPSAAFGGDVEALIDELVGQFDLGSTAIRNAAKSGLGANSDADPAQDPYSALGKHLWEACRLQSRSGESSVAQRIECRAKWDDLVLPDPQTEQLRMIVSQLKQRTKVYEDWGFGEKLSRGLGLTALFSGTSGTGKTMAAEVIANELRLDLVVVDLSTVMDKFIGETEKNLRRVFDVAERSGAVLLFDEADALFGKRSEVKDSHDRYANIGVSYLLTRMESYRGLAILTTNRRDVMDEAFIRRLRFIVTFPYPDAEQRLLIWKRVFPAPTPLGNVDFERLAGLDATGAMIRNIALGAAFVAAEDGQPVGMSTIMRVAQSEYSKYDRIIPSGFESP